MVAVNDAGPLSSRPLARPLRCRDHQNAMCPSTTLKARMTRGSWPLLLSLLFTACISPPPTIQAPTPSPEPSLSDPPGEPATKSPSAIATVHLVTPSPSSTLTGEASDERATQETLGTAQVATLEAYYRPPPATLEIDTKEQVSGIGGYCWRGECADGPAIRTVSEPLAAQSPIEAHLRLPRSERPDVLSLQALRMAPEDEIQRGQDWREWNIDKDPALRLSLSLDREPRFTISLEPGVYVLLLFVAWDGVGDVLYGFLLDVQ